MLQSKSSKLEKKNLLEASTSSDNVIKKYDNSFKKLLARSLNRSIMASMIYVVSRNRTRGIGYDSDSEKDDIPKTFQTHFVPYGKKYGVVPKVKTFSKPKVKAKAHSCFNYACMYKYPAQKPKFVRNSGKTNQKGPRKLWGT